MFPGIFLVAASYAECDEIQVVIYFVLAYTFDEINLAGTWPNVLDLAPNYVGPITGLSNTFQMISSIIAHYIIGLLTTNVSFYYIRISKILLIICIHFNLGISFRMAFRLLVDIWFLLCENDHFYTFRVGKNSTMECFKQKWKQWEGRCAFIMIKLC